MFKKILKYKGFWKSVLILSFGYLMILILIQWAFTGFSAGFFEKFTAQTVLLFLLGGFIVGFMVTYGKYWGKLKQEEFKNNK